MLIALFLKALIISTSLHALISPGESLISPAESLISPEESSVDLIGLLDFEAATDPTASLQTQSLSSDAQEYVAAHNAARLRNGVPTLQWDGKLALYAQSWADQRIGDCNHKHHSQGPYGENTLWEQYDEKTPAEVTQVWIDEEANYDHVKMDCKCKPERFKCMCGHYTQLVWSTTRSVGCGNVTCNGDLGFLVVCSYNPPGNYVNQNPFQNGQLLPYTGGAATWPFKRRIHRRHPHHHRSRGKVL